MPTTSEHLLEQIKIQDALLKLKAEQSLLAFVEQAWHILEPDTPFTITGTLMRLWSTSRRSRQAR